jgi:hypothetical protein
MEMSSDYAPPSSVLNGLPSTLAVFSSLAAAYNSIRSGLFPPTFCATRPKFTERSGVNFGLALLCDVGPGSIPVLLIFLASVLRPSLLQRMPTEAPNMCG